MFVLLIVSLFTSRIVLVTLGVSDYGTYNIVGGVVILFSFLNSALTSATQRFLNFSLGKGDEEALHKVYCMSMSIYFILSLMVILLAETIGLWFVNTQLNLPIERMGAVNWVYQFSILTFVLNMLRIPDNATLLAFERMDFYAYLSLIDAVLKLVIAYSLYISPIDKLIFYGLLLLVVNVIVNVCYHSYCVHSFKSTARYNFLWDQTLFKQLFSFSSWSLFGSSATVVAQYGLNILVNIFYGVTLNAALGLANQVSNCVTQFYTNFQTAFNPQIVKNYASGKKEDFFKLIYGASKFSFFLMFIVSLPLMFEIDKVLNIWLVEVPKYTGVFCQLILTFYMIEALAAPMWMAVQATGKIKIYQILVSFINFFTLPFVYVVLAIGYPVWSVWIVRILINIVILIYRLFYLRKLLGLDILKFLKYSILPSTLVPIITVPFVYLWYISCTGYWTNLITTIVFSVLITILCIFFIGLTAVERAKFSSLALTKLHISHRCL